MVTLADQGFYQALAGLQNGIDKGISYHNMFRPGGTNQQEQLLTDEKLRMSARQRQALDEENQRKIDAQALASRQVDLSAQNSQTLREQQAAITAETRARLGYLPQTTAGTLAAQQAAIEANRASTGAQLAQTEIAKQRLANMQDPNFGGEAYSPESYVNPLGSSNVYSSYGQADNTADNPLTEESSTQEVAPTEDTLITGAPTKPVAKAISTVTQQQVDPRFQLANDQLRAQQAVGDAAKQKLQLQANQQILPVGKPVVDSVDPTTAKASGSDLGNTTGGNMDEVSFDSKNKVPDTLPLEGWEAPTRSASGFHPENILSQEELKGLTSLTPQDAAILAYKQQNGLMPAQGGNAGTSQHDAFVAQQQESQQPTQSIAQARQDTLPPEPPVLGKFVPPTFTPAQEAELTKGRVTVDSNGLKRVVKPTPAEIFKLKQDMVHNAYQKWKDTNALALKNYQIQSSVHRQNKEQNMKVDEKVNTFAGAVTDSNSALNNVDKIMEKLYSAKPGPFGLWGGGALGNATRSIASLSGGETAELMNNIDQLKASGAIEGLSVLKNTIVGSRINQAEVASTKDLIAKLNPGVQNFPEQIQKIRDTLLNIKYVSSLRAAALQGMPPDVNVQNSFIAFAQNSPKYKSDYPGLNSSDPATKKQAIVRLMNQFYRED